MNRNFGQFVMIKLGCYLIVTLPIVGICWFCFGKWGGTGAIPASLGVMFLLHQFATEENVSGYRWQRWFVMRYRHYIEMTEDSPVK